MAAAAASLEAGMDLAAAAGSPVADVPSGVADAHLEAVDIQLGEAATRSVAVDTAVEAMVVDTDR